MLRCCNTNDGSPWFSSRCNKSASLRLQLEVLCGAEWQNSIHHALLNNKLICNPAKNKNHESNLDRGLRQQLSSKFLTKSKRQKKLQKIVLTLYRTQTGSDFELYSEKNSSMRFSFCFKPPLTHGWERILLLTIHPWFSSRCSSLSFVNRMFRSSLSSRWTLHLQNFVTTEDKTKKKEADDEGSKAHEENHQKQQRNRSRRWKMGRRRSEMEAKPWMSQHYLICCSVIDGWFSYYLVTWTAIEWMDRERLIISSLVSRVQ